MNRLQIREQAAIENDIPVLPGILEMCQYVHAVVTGSEDDIDFKAKAYYYILISVVNTWVHNTPNSHFDDIVKQLCLETILEYGRETANHTESN